MNRLAGIIMAAVGLIVAILSIVNIIPGLTATGVALILGGGLVIGLSFINRPDTEGVERMSTGATLGNIFFAPGETFRNFRRHPRFLVAMMIVTLASAIYGNLFINRLGAERVANFAIDKTLETPFVANNEQAKTQIEAGRPRAIADARDPVKRAGQAVNGFVASLFLTSLAAAVFMLFSLAMGGKINFYQAFSVAIYASFPVSIIRFVLNTILLYVKDPSDIHPILGQQTLIQDSLNFLVLPAEHPVLFTLLGAFSLLGFYWVWLIGTGLKNAGEKVSGTAAWAAAIGLYVLLVLFGVALAAIFPSFIS